MKFVSQPPLACLLAFGIFALTGILNAQQVPQLLSYQGRVVVGTGTAAMNFGGSGQFKFVLADSTGTVTYWSNDGTSSGGGQPGAAVILSVTNGLYSVILGDTNIPNMTAIPAGVFANADVRLRVWFNDGSHGFELLTPDQRIAAVGYAITAGTAALAQTVPNGSIGSAQLAPNAVGASQLAANSVGTTQIAAGAVGSMQLGAGAVTTSAISPGAVTGAGIAAGSISQAQLASVSVGQFNVLAGGLALSASASSQQYDSAFDETPLTNAEVSITVSGRPVELSLLTSPNLAAGITSYLAVGAANDSTPQLMVKFYRSVVGSTGQDVPGTETLVQLLIFSQSGPATLNAQNLNLFPPTSARCFDTTTAAGIKYHYFVNIQGAGTFANTTYDEILVLNVILMAKEL